MTSQQGPSRSFLRLASLVRPTPAPAPAPAPSLAPAPTFVRPSFPRPGGASPPTASVVSSPQAQAPPPPVVASFLVPPRQPPSTTASLPTSPAAKTRQSAPSTPIIAQTIHPASTTVTPLPSNLNSSSSPIITKPSAKSPPQFTKNRLLSPLSAPKTVPLAQTRTDTDLEPKIPLQHEQKSVPLLESMEKPMVMMPKASNDDQRMYALVGNTHSQSDTQFEKPATNQYKEIRKNLSSDEDFGMRIITIAGENKGAIMEMSRSSRKYGHGQSLHSQQKNDNPKTQSDGDKSGSSSSSSDEEEGYKIKDKNCKAMTKKTPTMSTAFVNSNVQGVNNSMLYNVTCSHHDPGVHISLSGKKANGKLSSHPLRAERLSPVN